MTSVLHPWVMNIGLRQQGVLVSAMRGCDTAPRHDPSKLFQRILRGAVLVAHAGREVKPASYIVYESDEQKWWDAVHSFSASWDHYPNHYVVHVIHAAEIIGYYGPKEDPVYANRWFSWYHQCCKILHFNPESFDQLSRRLDADEEKFRVMQAGYHRG